MDVLSFHSQTSAILAAVEIRSQLRDISSLPTSCGSPCLGCGVMQVMGIDPSTIMPAFIKAVQLTPCLYIKH